MNSHRASRESSRSQAFSIIAVALLSMTLVGCPKPPPPLSFDLGRALPLDDEAALRVMEEYQARVSEARAMQGLARVALTGTDFRLNRPQRIAVASPSRLRFEVLGPFDVLAGLLVSDGIEYGYYDALRGHVDRGFVTRDLLWELARLDLDPNEVVDLLLAAPLPRTDRPVAGLWQEPDSGYTVAYGDPGVGGAVYFRFDPEGELRELRALEVGGATRVRATFARYAAVSGESAKRRYPMRIRVESPKVGATAEFGWKRIMLAEELPDRLFEIPSLGNAGG